MWSVFFVSMRRENERMIQNVSARTASARSIIRQITQALASLRKQMAKGGNIAAVRQFRVTLAQLIAQLSTEEKVMTILHCSAFGKYYGREFPAEINSALEELGYQPPIIVLYPFDCLPAEPSSNLICYELREKAVLSNVIIAPSTSPWHFTVSVGTTKNSCGIHEVARAIAESVMQYLTSHRRIAMPNARQRSRRLTELNRLKTALSAWERMPVSSQAHWKIQVLQRNIASLRAKL
jgi:hypothetical protein